MNRYYMVLMTAQATIVLILGWEMEGWISKMMLIYGGAIAGHVFTELLNGE